MAVFNGSYAISSSNSGPTRIRLEVVQVSQDVATNQSTITWKLSASAASYVKTSAYRRFRTPKLTIKKGGTTLLNYTGSYDNLNTYITTTLGSNSLTVDHDDDGSASLSFTFSCQVWNGSSYSTSSGTGTMQLTQIPRAPQVVADTYSISINPNALQGVVVLSVTCTPQSDVFINKFNNNGVEATIAATTTVNYTDTQLYNLIGPFNNGSLIFEGKAYTTDEVLIGINTAVVDVSTALTPLTTGQNSTGQIGVAVGKKVEREGFDCDLPAYFNDVVTMPDYMRVVEFVAFDNKALANSGTDNGYIDIPAPEGYVPVAAVGYRFTNATTSGTGSSNIVVTQMSIVDQQLRYYIANRSTSTIRVKLTAQVLCVYGGLNE